MSPHDDDPLARATRALRDTGAPSRVRPEDLHRTRERVLESARALRTRRSRAFFLTRVAFPIAAVLVGTTAWAAGTGRLQRVLLEVRGAFVAEPASVAETKNAEPKPSGGGQPVAATESAAAPELAPTPAPTLPPVVAASSAASSAPSAKAVPSVIAAAPPLPAAAPTVVDEKPAAPAAEDDAGSADIALYKRAHKLHFIDKSYPAALVAWDEYLKASPSGAFVAEARYNRAICLIKVGRPAEAKLALAPFASGSVAGGYRKDEARALIDALSQVDGSHDANTQ